MTVAAGPVAAQDLRTRIEGSPDAIVRISYAAKPGVCGQGENKTDRFGLRLQGKFMFNFLSGGMAIGCGSVGCGGAVSGTGQVQFEPMAGLIIAF